MEENDSTSKRNRDYREDEIFIIVAQGLLTGEKHTKRSGAIQHIAMTVANAAKHSVLIKGGLYLETVGKADIYCFDKTGTLTMEQPEIIAVIGRTPKITEESIITMAATAESHGQGNSC